MPSRMLFLCGALLLAALPAGAQGVRAIDVTPGAGSSSPRNLVAYDGKLYFHRTANTEGEHDELWSYDPTTDTATMLGALPALSIQDSSPENRQIAALDGKIYFSASATTGGLGAVWAFDLNTGTAAAVVDQGLQASNFLAYGGLLYFTGIEGGRRYFRYSPVNGNAVRIGDESVYAVTPLTPFFGKLYFGGNGLFYYDPTTFSVELAAEHTSHPSFYPDYLTPLGNYLLFNGRHRAWYTYDVASDSVEVVEGSELPSGEGHLRRYTVTHFGHAYTWRIESGQPVELWKISPVGSAVRAWTLPVDGGGFGGAPTLTSFEDRLYFAMEGDERGLELWRTAGEDGVELVADINPRSEPPTGSRPRNLTVLDGKLYFVATDGNTTYGSEVWVYDPSNAAPTAVADAGTTDEDVPVTIDVLANDTDPEGDALTVTEVSAPSNGSAVIEGDGTVTYAPAEDFSGTDAFTYTVSDGALTAQATVTITVTPVNDAPTASVITSPEDGASITLAGNPEAAVTVVWTAATDADGDDVSYRWKATLTEGDFAEPLLVVETAEDSFETTYGALDTALAEAGVEAGESVVLYHRVVASDGTEEAVGPTATVTLTRPLSTDTEGGALPTAFAALGVYPNPSVGAPRITVDLPWASEVTVELYDVLGRRVAELKERLEAGHRRDLPLEGLTLPTGVYVYRLTAVGPSGADVTTGRFTVVR